VSLCPGCVLLLLTCALYPSSEAISLSLAASGGQGQLSARADTVGQHTVIREGRGGEHTAAAV